MTGLEKLELKLENWNLYVKRHRYFYNSLDASTETIQEVLDKAATEAFPGLETEKKETPEDIKKRARKPPADGPCRGCGKNLPLNRLMLCYKCWVAKRNSDSGWREGQPHPASCGCDLECRFESKSNNN